MCKIPFIYDTKSTFGRSASVHTPNLMKISLTDTFTSHRGQAMVNSKIVTGFNRKTFLDNIGTTGNTLSVFVQKLVEMSCYITEILQKRCENGGHLLS